MTHDPGQPCVCILCEGGMSSYFSIPAWQHCKTVVIGTCAIKLPCRNMTSDVETNVNIFFKCIYNK